MKIERINDNQVKIMLTRIDLDERDIKIGELAYGSEKAQALFRDIMEEAQAQCGFEAENLPLMIEAIPYSQDSITIIVTKVQNSSDLEERFKHLRRKLHQAQGDDDDRGEVYRLGSMFGGAPGEYDDREAQEADPLAVMVFSFDTLDEAASVAAKIYAVLPGRDHAADSLYKLGRHFYLYIEPQEADEEIVSRLSPIAGEFGRRHSATKYSKYYFLEHGTVLIKDGALEKLAVHLGD